MAISFRNIPNGILAPFFGIDFKSFGNNYPATSFPLLIGQKLTTGSVADKSVTLVGDKQEDALFGRGSIASRMVKAFKKNNPTATPYVFALADPSGNKASSTVTVTTSTATVDETLIIEIGGRKIYVTVLAGQSNTTIKNNIVTAINNDLDNACDAVSATSSTATIRHKHIGAIGNGLRVRVIGTPTLVFTVADLSSGTGDRVLTGNESYFPENILFSFMGSPYSDSTSLDFYKSLMSDVSGRWAYLQDAYAHVISIKQDTFSNLSSFTLKNDEHQTVIVLPTAISSTPISEIVASVTAQAHLHLTTPPELSRALNGTVLEGVKIDSSFTFSDRNALYALGFSPLTVNRDGSAILDRVITTYLTDDNGVADDTYKDINIMAQLQYGARYYRNRMTTSFAKSYINNETLYLMRSEISNILRELESLDVFEEVEGTIKNLIVERNALSKTRIDVKFTPTHVSPLLQTATQIETKI